MIIKYDKKKYKLWERFLIGFIADIVILGSFIIIAEMIKLFK